MFTLILIAAIVGYLGAGAWAFGYVKGATKDKENGWETPMPLLSAIFWPILLTGIALSYVVLPAQRMGYAFQQAKLAKKKKRVAMQEKLRIEIQQTDKEIAEAERALEAEFRALEKSQKKARAR